MPKFKEVRVERRGAVAIIEIAAARRRNALTPELGDELVAALEAVESDPDLGAIVLCSDGPTFCAGGDRAFLARAARDPVADQIYRDLRRIYRVFAEYRQASLPTVAAVQGTAIGAGVNLALMCDLRIVADDVRLIGFAPAGIHPGGGNIDMLKSQLNSQAAAALTLFGQTLNAEQAVSSGFAWRSVAPDDLRRTAVDIADAAARDPELVRVVVGTWRGSTGNLAPDVAHYLESGPQAWSLRRSAADTDGVS